MLCAAEGLRASERIPNDRGAFARRGQQYRCPTPLLGTRGYWRGSGSRGPGRAETRSAKAVDYEL